MRTFNIPGFTADVAVGSRRGRFAGGGRAEANPPSIVPAIPNCANCDYILDRCADNGGRPRAVCNACARGNCYDEPPMPNPYPNPWDSGPPHWRFD